MKRLLVIGHGMVGHRFLESAVQHGLNENFAITLVGEEPRLAYDRVHLSAWFEGSGEDELRLCPDGWLAENGIAVSLGTRAVSVDPATRTVTTEAGETLGYDELVLATGSTPFVPPLEGVNADGVFVYRTIDDLIAIDKAAAGASIGVVLGGGLLGLEAANALRLLGLETHVVEVAPRLMAVQLDDGGAKLLRRKIEDLGIRCHVGVGASAVLTDGGNCRGLLLADGTELSADLVVVAAGIRPRDDLADCRAGAGRTWRVRGRRHPRHLRCGSVGDRRMRGAPRPLLRPGCPRLPDGRDARGSPRRRRQRDLRGCRPVDQAEAGRCRRGQLRRCPRCNAELPGPGLGRPPGGGLQEARPRPRWQVHHRRRSRGRYQRLRGPGRDGQGHRTHAP